MPVTSLGDFGATGGNLIGFYDLDRSTYASDWQRQAAVYQRTQKYYSGAIFDEATTKPTQPGEAKELMYPLRINVIQRTCITHALHLWGLTDEGPLLRFTIKPGKSAKSAKARSEKYKAFLDGLWNAPDTETLLRRAARVFMKDGGAYLKLRLDGSRPQNLALESPLPQFVFPVWNPADYTDLLRVHIVFPLDATAAKLQYGVPVKEDAGLLDYVETWTKDGWLVQIRKGDTRYPARNPETNEVLAGENLCRDPKTGKAYIPITYVPRLATDGFYGLNIPDMLRGMQNELNARFADYGDAVTTQTHSTIVGHDITAKRQTYDGTIELPVGKVFDMGDSSVGGVKPEMYTLNYGNLTQGVGDLNDDLQSVLYDQAGLPPVMRGIDEGSQRSALTLAMRALPTLAMITDYRANWRQGIDYINHAAVLISLAAGINELDKAMLEQSVLTKFAPVLPKDIEQINQTIATQRGAKVMSVRRALTLSPDVDDVEAELAELKAEQEAEMARQQEQIAMEAAQQDQQLDKSFAQ